MNDKDLDLLNDIDLDDIEVVDEKPIEDTEIVIKDNEDDNKEKETPAETSEDDDLISLMNEIENTSKKKKKAATKKASKPAPEPKKQYEGPRHIKVYGEELWIENDPKVTNEEIRQRIVDEFGFGEFRKDKTIFDLDEETGILDVAKQYQKKG